MKVVQHIQLIEKINKHVLRPICFVNIGNNKETVVETILCVINPNVNPNDRSFVGKHSTMQIDTSGVMPTAVINKIKPTEITGVQ